MYYQVLLNDNVTLLIIYLVKISNKFDYEIYYLKNLDSFYFGGVGTFYTIYAKLVEEPDMQNKCTIINYVPLGSYNKLPMQKKGYYMFKHQLTLPQGNNLVPNQMNNKGAHQTSNQMNSKGGHQMINHGSHQTISLNAPPQTNIAYPFSFKDMCGLIKDDELLIYDRKTFTLFLENINQLIIKLVKFEKGAIDKYVGRISSQELSASPQASVRSENTPLTQEFRESKKVLMKLLIGSLSNISTSLVGKYYNSKRSKNNINNFIEAYNIDISEYSSNEINNWKTFNDFFSRKINMKMRPAEIINKYSVRSPCDSRIVCFQKNQFLNLYNENKSNDSYRAKKKFIIYDLIPYIQNYYEIVEGSGFICRLAPQDYHHFHAPIDMIIESVQMSGNKLYSVNPIMDDNVYDELNIDFLNDNFKIIFYCRCAWDPTIKIYYIIIGATLVGSIKFNNIKLSETIKKISKDKEKYHQFSTDEILCEAGNDIGSFYYGGSTVAVLFNHQLLFDYDLLYFSTYTQNNGGQCIIESRVCVNQHLGLISE